MSHSRDLVTDMRSCAIDYEDDGKLERAELVAILRGGAAEIERLRDEFKQFAEALAEGYAGKIHAIKAYRIATGASLIESNNWVESQFGSPPINTTRH